MKVRNILASLSSVSAVAASFAGNINYRSPSARHPNLGIAIDKVQKRSDPAEAHDLSKLDFTHGVSSGDPYHDSVILWTRAAPTDDNDKSNVTVSKSAGDHDHNSEEFVKPSKNPICVEWEISPNEELDKAVDSGTIYTSSDIDYTVKVSETEDSNGGMVLIETYSGRSIQAEAVHAILLPIQNLRHGHQKPGGEDEDDSPPG